LRPQHLPRCTLTIRPVAFILLQELYEGNYYLSGIASIFFDVGGVLLTNAWDHAERAQALARFKVDLKEFQPLHQDVVEKFECGEITLDQYLERTIFFRPRTFSPEQFKSCMFSLSQALAGRLELAKGLAKSGKLFMGTINNESRELNAYRIHTFGLRQLFSVFVSSCYVGLRKPNESIYRCALELTQRVPKECCFIDDREENLVPAAKLGMRVIQARSTEQIKKDLAGMGVTW
jgi:putative hydrolase of the HAD superfamily